MFFSITVLVTDSPKIFSKQKCWIKMVHTIDYATKINSVSHDLILPSRTVYITGYTHGVNAAYSWGI